MTKYAHVWSLTMTDERPPQDINHVRIHVSQVLTKCDAMQGWLRSNEPVNVFIALKKTIDELRIIEKDLEKLQ